MTIGCVVEHSSLFNTPNTMIDDAIERRKSKVGLLFYSFSPHSNFKKVTTPINKNFSTACFNGIRVLTNWKVILSHTVVHLRDNAVVNYQELEELEYSTTYRRFVRNRTSVDIFFFISGFVISYVFVNKLLQAKGKQNFFKLMLHRYLRLAPAYFFVII